MKLLIIEDDLRFRETLALEFADRGYEVTTAVNGKDVIRILATQTFRFALVDLRLGQDHGLEMIDLLKKSNPECRIVMMTGYGSIATAVAAVKRGAAHYLTKPVTIDTLAQALWSDTLDEKETELKSSEPSLARHEREYIEFVLLGANQNISEAARRLGIHRQSLQRKLRKFTPH